MSKHGSLEDLFGSAQSARGSASADANSRHGVVLPERLCRRGMVEVAGPGLGLDSFLTRQRNLLSASALRVVIAPVGELLNNLGNIPEPFHLVWLRTLALAFLAPSGSELGHSAAFSADGTGSLPEMLAFCTLDWLGRPASQMSAP